MLRYISDNCNFNIYISTNTMAMKIKIGDKIYDPEFEPIAIGFTDDEERLYIASCIRDNFQSKEGPRVYTVFPQGSMDPAQILDFINPLKAEL